MSSSVRLVLVGAESVGGVWDHVRDWFASALEHSDGNLTLRDVYESLERGDSHLWIAMGDGIALAAGETMFVRYPRKTVLLLRLVGGRGLKEWRALQPQMEAWAKRQGCSDLEIIGRPGLKRMLPGWSEKWTVLRKALT